MSSAGVQRQIRDELDTRNQIEDTPQGTGGEKTMSTTASRCDQIIALIDACLAEVESSSGAGLQALHMAGDVNRPSSPTHSRTSR
jgi:hypothetical protein